MITAILAAGDDETGLAMTLSALVAAATEGVVRDAIVVDGGSRDGTRAVADAAGCSVVPAKGGDGLRRAAEAARGDWLLFLPSGSVVEANWQGEALAFIDRAVLAGEGTQSAAAFRLGRVEPGWRARRAEWLAGLRSRLFAAPREAQGLLISRAFYRSLGGHRPLPAMADVDLARRIGGRRLTLLRSRAYVRGGGAGGSGLVRGLRNAACLALFVLRLPPGLIVRIAILGRATSSG